MPGSRSGAGQMLASIPLKNEAGTPDASPASSRESWDDCSESASASFRSAIGSPTAQLGESSLGQFPYTPVWFNWWTLVTYLKGAHMPTITTKDGVEIFYKDWGSGQPIVFSHGWPLSADDWDAQMLFFLQ